MHISCVRCAIPAAIAMTFDYGDRAVWLDELEGPPEPGSGYAMCTGHADRMSPPVGWTLTDRRNVTRLFAPARADVVA